MKHNKYQDKKPTQPLRMEVVKIISETKKIRRFDYMGKPLRGPVRGDRRVEAIVRIGGGPMITRHINVPRK